MANHTAADPSPYHYNKNNDPHVHAVDRLVSELGIPAEEVNKSYREILAELEKDIKVKEFLPLLVSMGVKERLLPQR